MKKVALIMATAAIFTLFASCGSTPEPEETAPEAPVVEDTSAEVEETEPEEIVVEEDTSASDAEEREAILAKIEEARKAALEAGADKKASNIWSELDRVYNELKNSEGDISASGADLAARYQALTAYAQAKDEKKKIDDNDFAKYDQKNYDDGSELLAAVEEAFEAENWDASTGDKALKAYGKFKNVTFAAYKQLALEERDVRRLADRIGEESDRDRGFEVPHLDLGLDGGVPLQPGDRDEVHVVEGELRERRNLRLDEERRNLRIKADGEIVQGNLDDILANLFRVLEIVGQRLRVGDHDEDFVEFAGVLKLHAAPERPDIVSDMKFAGGSVTGQDGFSHR